MKTRKQVLERIEYLRERKREIKGMGTFDKLSKSNKRIYLDLESSIQTLIWTQTKRPCKYCGRVHKYMPFTDCHNPEEPLPDSLEDGYSRTNNEAV